MVTEIGFYDSTRYEGSSNFLYTWTIHDVNKIPGILNGSEFLLPGGKNCQFSLRLYKDCLHITMKSSCVALICSVTFFTCTGVSLFCSKFMKQIEQKENEYLYSCWLYFMDDTEKFKDLPEKTLVIECCLKVCIFKRKFAYRQGCSANRNLQYLKRLADVFENASDCISKEKVTLCIGDEFEIVNKTVLCSQSPVFADMLDIENGGNEKSSVQIDDVKIEVMRGLVSFLYSGRVPDGDFYFLFDLYYAAKKYKITQLRDECRHLLMSKFTAENASEILKLSNKYNDEYLKFGALLFIGSNLLQVVTTEGWKDLMIYEPKTALKVMDFFNLVE